jgi:hypothetical protein
MASNLTNIGPGWRPEPDATLPLRALAVPGSCGVPIDEVVRGHEADHGIQSVVTRA